MIAAQLSDCQEPREGSTETWLILPGREAAEHLTRAFEMRDCAALANICIPFTWPCGIAALWQQPVFSASKQFSLL